MPIQAVLASVSSDVARKSRPSFWPSAGSEFENR